MKLVRSTREKLTGYASADQIENLDLQYDVATSPAAIAFKNNRLTFAWLDGDAQKVIVPFPGRKHTIIIVIAITTTILLIIFTFTIL
jgi:hypothetical protein